MPIFINIPDSTAPEFLKIKGKIYKRVSSEPPSEGVFALDTEIEEQYNSNSDAYFGNKIYDLSEKKLRPKYAILTGTIPKLSAYQPNIINSYSVFTRVKDQTHPYYNQGSTTTFVLCGFFQNLELNLLRGKKYIFRQNDSSNLNLPVMLSTDPAGSNVIVFPTTNYTGTAGINGALSFTIPLTAEDTYYLTSNLGTYMGIKINVDKFNESLPSHTVEFSSLSSEGYYNLLNKA